MTIQKGENPHHPVAGSSILVEPIRKRSAIQRIKKQLSDSPRNLALFTLGINTAFRCNELLSIRYGQVKDAKPGDILTIKQSKTQTYRSVMLNKMAISALEPWLNLTDKQRKFKADEDPIFCGLRGNVLTVPSVSQLVKTWCQNAGLKGNYASHSLRKTWGFHQYKNGTSILLLVEAFGHSTERQTREYLCIPREDVNQIYEMEL